MNGPAIDQVFADETGGNGVLWYLSDTQNTVRDVAKYESTTVGTQATVRNHLEYNTFGIVTSVDDPTTAAVNDGDRPALEGVGNEFSPQRSYTGREPDHATGLIYYRARWFDPRIGRFISEDPIGFAAGDANLSRYVGNSTPNAVDPSGLELWVVFLPEPEPEDPHAAEKRHQARIRGRKAQEALEQAADVQSRPNNPRVTQILNADGSVSTVTDAMDEGVRAELENSVIGSTRSPRRYGQPGENLGQCIQPGTAAVPFQDADWNDVRQERLAEEAELERSRLIMEIGVVTIPMMIIPGPDELLLSGLGGRLKQGSVAAKAIDGVDDAAKLASTPKLFRGGKSLRARLGVDVKAAADGLIHPLAKNGKPQGLSLNINPLDPFIQKYGGAFPLNGLPEGLQALQSGKAGHFVIAPKAPMTFEAFQNLLNQVNLGGFNALP
jgi:RHS repeat-associated protein